LIVAETKVVGARADVDIQADIERVVVRYPPLNNDRHHIHLAVEGGMVTLRGHVKTPISRRHLQHNMAQIRGNNGVDATAFIDDENLRIEVGRGLPPGVLANCEYGIVILSGTLPAGTTADDLVSQVAKMPGVRKVVTALR
jgi:osmotically-inducible protein OsmY